MRQIDAACAFYEPLAKGDFGECGRRLEAARGAVKNFHESGGSALAGCGALAEIYDRLLLCIYELFAERRKGRPALAKTKFCVIALGGYGRREMCPRSDVDIMFLFSRSLSKQLKNTVADAFLYPLWNLRAKVGHVALTSTEALQNASRDPIFRNALLDARLVCGSAELFGRFGRKFALSAFLRKGEYTADIMRLKYVRHCKAGQTPYLQEPDIKNGIGGVRDFNSMLWELRLNAGSGSLAQAARRGVLSAPEYLRAMRALEFLLGVRARLHCISTTPTETIDAEFRESLAEFFEPGAAPLELRTEAFMRRLYGALTAVDFAVKTVERRLKLKPPDDIRKKMRAKFAERAGNKKIRFGDFTIWRGEVSARGSQAFARGSAKILDAFRTAQIFGAELSGGLEISIRRASAEDGGKALNSPQAAQKFLQILRDGGRVAPALRAMHGAGVLAAVLPEFKAITHMLQRDFYHRYTADMHTINAMGVLDKIFCATAADGVFWRYHKVLMSLASPDLIYAMLLLHDIGKGAAAQNHARAGAGIAKAVLRRWNLPQSDIDAVVFAVENHLEMSRFWQRNDVDDEEAVLRFAKLAGTEANLKNLYILTFCDANATSESFWNSYKQSLHETLYANALAAITAASEGGAYRGRDIEIIAAEIIASGELAGRENLLFEHIQNLPSGHLSGYGRADIVRHVQLIADFARCAKTGAEQPAIDWNDHPMRSMTSLCVVSRDRSGLFLTLVGVLTLMGFDILGSKILTRADGITVDTFFLAGVSDGILQNAPLRDNFKRLLARANAGNLALDAEAEKIFAKSSRKLGGSAIKSARVFRRARRIVLEVIAYDCRGVLYKIAKMIRARGYDILFARVNTEHTYGKNTFYIKKSRNNPK